MQWEEIAEEKKKRPELRFVSVLHWLCVISLLQAHSRVYKDLF